MKTKFIYKDSNYSEEQIETIVNKVWGEPFESFDQFSDREYNNLINYGFRTLKNEVAFCTRLLKYDNSIVCCGDRDCIRVALAWKEMRKLNN